MYAPERAFAEKFEQTEAPLTPKEEVVYEKYVPRWRAAEPKPEDFKGVYNDIEIQNDKKFVAERKGVEKDKHERAQLFEALLFHALDQEEWLGERAYVARASEFDDRVNGTDLVVEFLGRDGQVRRLAVDVTVTANIDTIRTKVQNIKQNLEAGRLVNLKYFESEIPDETKAVRGSVHDLPRVIVGVDPNTLKELARSFTEHAAEDHPLQRELLEEIRLQLEEELAAVEQLVPKDRQELVRQKLLEVIEEVRAIETKKEKVPPLGARRDRTMHLLSDRLREVWPGN